MRSEFKATKQRRRIKIYKQRKSRYPQSCEIFGISTNEYVTTKILYFIQTIHGLRVKRWYFLFEHTKIRLNNIRKNFWNVSVYFLTYKTENLLANKSFKKYWRIISAQNRIFPTNRLYYITLVVSKPTNLVS